MRSDESDRWPSPTIAFGVDSSVSHVRREVTSETHPQCSDVALATAST